MDAKSAKTAKKLNVKKTIIVVLALFFILALVGSSKGKEEVDNGDSSEVGFVLNSDVQHREKAIGISDQDINEVLKNEISSKGKLSVTNVNNDKTGRWRKLETAIGFDVERIALSYYQRYFTDDQEIHFIVNFAQKTTTRISKGPGILFVTIKEYVDGEQHDAATLSSGMTLADYWVYLDNGDIIKISDDDDDDVQ